MKEQAMTPKNHSRSVQGAFVAGALLLATLTPTSASAAAFQHRAFMRGKILEGSGAGIYLCIGSADRAEVGQVLPVFRRVWGISAARSPWSQWRRVETGQVRIEAIVDGHMARATLVSGKAEVGSRVELAQPRTPWHGSRK
jgi:hypothetical protein